MWLIIMIFGIYKATEVPTFLLGLIQISQAVAEKWVAETLETLPKKLFLLYDIQTGDQSSWFSGFIKALSVPTFEPNLVKINPAVAEKKAFEIEGMDARTDAQSVFIV